MRVFTVIGPIGHAIRGSGSHQGLHGTPAPVFLFESAEQNGWTILLRLSHPFGRTSLLVPAFRNGVEVRHRTRGRIST